MSKKTKDFATAILIGVAVFIILGSWVCSFTLSEPIILKQARRPLAIIDNRPHLYDIEFERCLENIRQTESFQSKWYICPSGNRTIGFGHKKKPWEVVSDTSITLDQANSMLKQDFGWAIDYAISFGYRQRNYEQLTVAHAIYCLGYDRVREIIGKGFPDHILNYSGYWKDGKLIKGGSVEKSRIFELELFNKRY
jgi:hypothetical protein